MTARRLPPRGAPPTALVVPFPVHRRGAFLRRQVGAMMRISPVAAENYLAAALERHAAVLRKKGVAAPAIAADVKAMETAIRVALWRGVLEGGAA